jgi:hypothetical protein
VLRGGTEWWSLERLHAVEASVNLVVESVVTLAILGGLGYLAMRRRRERDGNAPVRDAIDGQVTFQVPLRRASVLGTGGFGGTRGWWISLRGPKRLTVGTDAFMVSAPQALREFVFIGRDTSIALSRAPSGVADREWIVITRRGGGREQRVAITADNLSAVWQALAGTGATPTLAPAVGGAATGGTLTSRLGSVTGWRRVALMLGFVVVFAFIPALVQLIERQLH